MERAVRCRSLVGSRAHVFGRFAQFDLATFCRRLFLRTMGYVQRRTTHVGDQRSTAKVVAPKRRIRSAARASREWSAYLGYRSNRRRFQNFDDLYGRWILSAIIS